jgi:hypothetical protein
MRKTIILAAGLALVATSAFSQTSPRDREDTSRGWYDGRGDSDRGRDFGQWHGRMMRDHDEGRDYNDRRADDGQRDETSGGARFFLRSGDTQLRIVCGDRESTRACVDAAMLLMERVQQQGSTTRSPAAPGSAQ